MDGVNLLLDAFLESSTAFLDGVNVLLDSFLEASTAFLAASAN
ncbi:hypothetical protein DJ66_0501 [Candidatus Liberibacter solanacearum]|uniref:Uncharacterized protein n=1 Tax=Candidatus Liberibacter solanacearum TaxID=556287 RepID=A0A0F4VM70_9HYPH|nr:hypothetical protein DJ66_0501 [Candidatus Liberibacter solanacearum]